MTPVPVFDFQSSDCIPEGSTADDCQQNVTHIGDVVRCSCGLKGWSCRLVSNSPRCDREEGLNGP